MNPPTIRGPRLPNPGHGHRHLTHLAAGLRLGGYATQVEDFSACYLNQENPFGSCMLRLGLRLSIGSCMLGLGLGSGSGSAHARATAELEHAGP